MDPQAVKRFLFSVRISNRVITQAKLILVEIEDIEAIQKWEEENYDRDAGEESSTEGETEFTVEVLFPLLYIQTYIYSI